jgi:hypothetical protein
MPGPNRDRRSSEDAAAEALDAVRAHFADGQGEWFSWSPMSAYEARTRDSFTPDGPRRELTREEESRFWFEVRLSAAVRFDGEPYGQIVRQLRRMARFINGRAVAIAKHEAEGNARRERRGDGRTGRGGE